MNVLIVNGHPDPAPQRLCHALADAYGEGVEKAGYTMRRIDVGTLDFPILRSAAAFGNGNLAPGIRMAQESIAWADHILFVYPLWHGMAPALFKAFLEQVFRYGFAMERDADWPVGLLRGKSARIVVTMGMPGWFYRIWYGAHSLRAFKRNILRFSGIAPVRVTVFGMVEGVSDAKRARWLAQMRAWGRKTR